MYRECAVMILQDGSCKKQFCRYYILPLKKSDFDRANNKLLMGMHARCAAPISSDLSNLALVTAGG